MSPEDNFNEEIWWMLQRLKKEQFLAMSGEKVAVDYEHLFEPESNDTNIPTSREQKKLLYKLMEWGILDWQIGGVTGGTGYVLSIHAKKFKEAYARFEKLATVQNASAGRDTDTEGGSGMKSKMKFENGVLRWGYIIHSFHRGQRGEKIRISFFHKLWNDRRWVKKGKERISGTPRTPLYFAVQLKLTIDSETFAKNKKPKNQLFGMTKGINRILKQKGFPAHIERKGDIQLVVTEK